VFGATVVTAVLAIEDLFLTVQPIRKGVPEIGIGNVIGSLVFSVTGKLGIVVLAGGSIAIGSNVLRWHLPALVLVTALAAYFLSTGQLKRWHGFVLLALYITYWIISSSSTAAPPSTTNAGGTSGVPGDGEKHLPHVALSNRAADRRRFSRSLLGA